MNFNELSDDVKEILDVVYDRDIKELNYICNNLDIYHLTQTWQNVIKSLCDSGISVKTNDEVDILKKLAKNGYTFAYISLANYYYRTEFYKLNNNYEKILNYYRKGDIEGCKICKFSLGYAYYHGAYGLEQDLIKAKNLFMESRDLGFNVQNQTFFIEQINQIIGTS